MAFHYGCRNVRVAPLDLPAVIISCTRKASVPVFVRPPPAISSVTSKQPRLVDAEGLLQHLETERTTMRPRKSNVEQD
jgi:hypothetical protein